MNSIQIEDIYNDSCMDDNSYEENISIFNDFEAYAVNDAFYIEYTVDNSCTYALDAYDSTNTYKYGIPRLFTTSTSTYYYNAYSKIEITLLDGTTTTNLSTPCSNVAKVKLWYPETSVRIAFYGNSDNETGPVVKTINYLNTTNFKTFYYMFYHCKKLVSVNTSNWSTSNVTEFGWMFYGCSSLTSVGDLSNFNTSKVTRTKSMFYGCSKLSSPLNLSNWNTINVTDISYMFYKCNELTAIGDLSNWNTSKVTNFCSLFYNCYLLTSIGDLSNWSIANATDIRWMFYGCNKLTSIGDLSNWNISKATSTKSMFNGCDKLTSIGDLSNWDTSNVTDMSYMFAGCTNLESIIGIENWNVGNVTDISYFMDSCYRITSLDLSRWNTDKLKVVYYGFKNCIALELLDLSNWKVENFQGNYGFRFAFRGCSSLKTLKLNNCNISNVATNISYSDLNTCSTLNKIEMENSNYSSVNQIISTLPTKTTDSMGVLNIAGVDDFSQVDTTTAQSKYWNISPMLIAKYTTNKSGVVPIFNSGYQYTKNETVSNDIYTVEITSNEDFTSCSFNNKSNLLTVEYLKVTDKVTSMKEMFSGCSKLTQLDVSNWDTSNVTTMAGMFYGCPSLTQLDVSNWVTCSVTNMNSMFQGCSQLTQLDVSNWDTSKVTSMVGMFYGCSKLTQLDASNWVTSSVTNMNSMFDNCSQLTQLDVSKWDTSSVKNMSYMFNKCTSLNDVVATNVSTSTLSTLVTALPTRTSDSYGIIIAMNTTSETTSSANAKYWNISVIMLIAKYTANASGVVPTFNEGYQYTINETVSNGIYTVEIDSDSDFTICSFSGKTNLLTVEYLKVTSQVTNMDYMFQNCSQLTQLDLSKWDIKNVTNMEAMFYNCSKLTQLDVGNLDTSQVTNMDYMFCNCSQLTQLDLSNFDTSKVTNMNYMFDYCDNLIAIGMIYCNLKTINTLSSKLSTGKAKQVYVHDVNSSECTEVSNITFIDYISDSNVITLPVTLVSGDEILWDDSSQRYIIKRSDGTTIQTDITSKFKIDLYTPYTMIYTNNVTSISVNIFRKEI